MKEKLKHYWEKVKEYAHNHPYISAAIGAVLIALIALFSKLFSGSSSSSSTDTAATKAGSSLPSVTSSGWNNLLPTSTASSLNSPPTYTIGRVGTVGQLPQQNAVSQALQSAGLSVLAQGISKITKVITDAITGILDPSSTGKNFKFGDIPGQAAIKQTPSYLNDPTNAITSYNGLESGESIGGYVGPESYSPWSFDPSPVSEINNSSLLAYNDYPGFSPPVSVPSLTPTSFESGDAAAAFGGDIGGEGNMIGLSNSFDYSGIAVSNPAAQTTIDSITSNTALTNVTGDISTGFGSSEGAAGSVAAPQSTAEMLANVNAGEVVLNPLTSYGTPAITSDVAGGLALGEGVTSSAVAGGAFAGATGEAILGSTIAGTIVESSAAIAAGLSGVVSGVAMVGAEVAAGAAAGIAGIVTGAAAVGAEVAGAAAVGAEAAAAGGISGAAGSAAETVATGAVSV